MNGYHTNLRLNPAPASSFSLPAKIPLKSASSPSFGASPLFGAFGVAIFLRFSCPALEGKVGNISLDLGLGFSSKYGWLSTSFAVSRFLGSKASSELRSSLPIAVKNGNFARIKDLVFCAVLGSLSDLAFGRRRNPGHVSSEGIPHSSNICSKNELVLPIGFFSYLRELVNLIFALQ